jgi:hypothetical protein
MIAAALVAPVVWAQAEEPTPPTPAPPTAEPAKPAEPAPAVDEARKQEARKIFDEARALAQQERWSEACPLFEKAHALHRTGGTTLQLANCYERIDELQKARLLYREILDNKQSEKVAERITIAEQRLAAVERRLAALEKPRQPEPRAEPAPPPKPDPSGDTSSEGPSPLAIGGYVAIGVGGVGIIIGAALGGAALAEESAVRDSCVNGVCPASEQENADAARSKAIGSDIALTVGGVVAAAGVVMLIVALTSEPDASALYVDPSGFGFRF